MILDSSAGEEMESSIFEIWKKKVQNSFTEED